MPATTTDGSSTGHAEAARSNKSHIGSPAPSLAVLLPGAPQRHSQIRYNSRIDTAEIMPSRCRSSTTAGQRQVQDLEPHRGFTVSELATKVHTVTGNTDYTIRQAAYDLRKLRGK